MARILMLGAASLVLVCAVTACKGKVEAKGPKVKKPVPVTVATAQAQDVPLELETYGTVQAIATVAVRAQVSEVLQQVHFEKGQLVHQGDVLFTIRDATFQEELTHAKGALAQAKASWAQAKGSLAQANATLERDQVQAARTQQDADRIAALLQQKVAAQDDFDAAAAAAQMQAKTVKADQAAVVSAQAAIDQAQAASDNAQSDIKTAELQLAYCIIKAPITGHVGNVLVTAGNLVKANDLPLVVINQISPIDVFFAVPQAQLDAIRGYLAAGELAAEVVLDNDTANIEAGQLRFIDNAVDTTTGTIQLAATFPNPHERLWPGRYVRVKLVLTVQRGVTVVPARAVQTGSDGQFVFTIDAAHKAAQRPVTVTRTHGDDALIATGLKPGEVVVTDGQLQLDDGTVVEEQAAGATDKDVAAAVPGSAAAPAHRRVAVTPPAPGATPVAPPKEATP